MNDIFKIDALLEQLQSETPNCGGSYCFVELPLTKYSDTKTSLQIYFSQFAKYKDPYTNYNSNRVYIKSYDVSNITLVPIFNFESYIEEKLEYWSNHRTSLDCREKFTENYKSIEAQFKEVLFNFLSNQMPIKTFSLKEFDTSYDHINDDTIIETQTSIYILHFGWSS